MSWPHPGTPNSFSDWPVLASAAGLTLAVRLGLLSLRPDALLPLSLHLLLLVQLAAQVGHSDDDTSHAAASFAP